MVYPLLPALLTGLGAGPIALGLLDGTADLASAGVKVGAGRLADRPGRRGPLVVLGYAIAVFVRPLISLALAAPQVIGLRIVDRLGKGVRTPPRDAIIADATPPDMRGRAFGLQRSLDNFGSVLGPLAAWAMLASGRFDVPGVIRASIVPGIIVLLLAIVAVRGTAARAGSAPSGARPAGWALPMPVALVAAFSLVRLPDALLLLRSQQLGVPVAAVTLLWAAVSVTRSLGSLLGGALSDRIGPARALGLGWLAYLVFGVGFALASASWHAWGLFLGLGLVLGFTEGPERALVAQLGAGKQGSAFGAFHGAQGIAALGGGLLLGILYQNVGPGVACAVSAAGAGLLRLAWTRA